MLKYLTIISALTVSSLALAQGKLLGRQTLVSGGETETLSVVLYLQIGTWAETPDVSCQSVQVDFEVAEPTGLVPIRKIHIKLDADTPFAHIDVPFVDFGGDALLLGVRRVQMHGNCARKLLIDSRLKNPDGSTAAAVGSTESIRALMAAYAADPVD